MNENIKRVTPRAIKLTPETIKAISNNKGVMNGDLPPVMDDLIDVATIPGDVQYYFVTDYPGVTPDKPISWVLVADFMFDERFKFATTPSKTQLTSIIEKE